MHHVLGQLILHDDHLLGKLLVFALQELHLLGELFDHRVRARGTVVLLRQCEHWPIILLLLLVALRC